MRSPAEEQWRKVETIATEGHWLVEERVAVAVAMHHKAILEVEAVCKVEAEP